MTARYSATFIARTLEKGFDPSPEQEAIIGAPFDECSIVIAGAGSGKTETMADRVIYLIANGFVTLDQVLGMTFTRKAANELAKRVREGIAKLLASGLDIPGGNSDEMYGATITTYNAFANRIYSNYAHLIGCDPDARVMSEATAWQLATAVATDGDHHDMIDLDRNLDTIVQGILDYGRGLKDNLATTAELRSFGEEFAAHVATIPDSEGRGKAATQGHMKTISGAVAVAQSMPLMVELVTKYEAEKARLGLMEFSDQVARAHEIVSRFPEVGQEIREQYKVVLLDEYQDTSNIQIEFLSSLFRGLAVTAVGDPNQAIYGWRGASASSMDTFRFFDKYAPQQTSPSIYNLSQSWRNPQVVLTAANRIASTLPTETDKTPLELVIGSTDTTGSLTVFYPETIAEEADQVAAWFDEKLKSWSPRPGISKDAKHNKPTAALLVRRVADLEAFKRAFDNIDVPYRVVGLGGLMTDPVIVDLVCALRVMNSASAESELIRLLAGPRWRIAPRDLRGLKYTATWLSKHDYARRALDKQVNDALRKSVAAEDNASLIDALDFITERADKSHQSLEKLSDEAFARLKEAGELFAALRKRTGLDLRELITVVLQALNLDIEAEANDTTASVEPVLSAFMNAVGSFVSTERDASLGTFLRWLEDAEKRDRMSPAGAEPEPGVIQLMTIHGSKGLEWHLVAVPRQVTLDSGAETRNSEVWTDFGTIPDEIRADYAELTPYWKWRTASDLRELAEDYATYRDGAKERWKAEQRRLAYVAVTRSMQHLLVSGSFWGTNKTLSPPNDYLTDIASVDSSVSLPQASAYSALPEHAGQPTESWPLDPLGKKGRRGPRVMAAKLLVENATPVAHGDIKRDIDLLLKEKLENATRKPVMMPVRVAASMFKDYIKDTEQVAERRRRPLPTEPYRATMLGTIFHAWVESRGKVDEELAGFGAEFFDERGERDIDAHELALGVEGPSAVDEAQLEKLKQTFLASEWGDRHPYATEIEIHLPLGDNIIICKIDAIYRDETQDGPRYDIVDWKTGQTPRDAADLELRQYQLALYRLAFARWMNIPLEHVSVALYFVAHDLVVRPDRVMNESELEVAWQSVFRAGNNPR